MDNILKITNEQRVTIVVDGEDLDVFRMLMRRMYESIRPEIKADAMYIGGIQANAVLQMANELIEI